MQKKYILFGRSQAVSFGWETDSTTPVWAAKALKRIQIVVSLMHAQIKQSLLENTVEAYLECFDLEQWAQNPGVVEQARLAGLFQKLCESRGVMHVPSQFKTVLIVALSRYNRALRRASSGSDELKKEVTSDAFAREVWVAAYIESKARNNLVMFSKCLCFYMSYNRSTCHVERHIGISVKLSDGSTQRARDHITVLRYGPTSVDKLAYKDGDGKLLGAPFARDCVERWIHFFGSVLQCSAEATFRQGR